jgi:hypothetical protein
MDRQRERGIRLRRGRDLGLSSAVVGVQPDSGNYSRRDMIARTSRTPR